MNRDELLEYVKEFLRRAIATRLKIEKEHLFTTPKAQAAVERCLITVIAIAENDGLDGAIDDLGRRHLTLGETVSRKDVRKEVEACYNTFRVEVDGLTTMRKITRPQTESKVLWTVLRERVPIGSDYDDNWVQAADAWILRGEKLDTVLGTATICSFLNPGDEAEFVQELIQTEVAKRKIPRHKISPCKTNRNESAL
jgi:hypothetical protein